MAISIAQQYHSDPTSLTDPFRIFQSFDYFGHTDQMEFNVNTSLDESINRNNYISTNNQDFQGLVDQAIEFVDSSQDSPTESWPNEYPKNIMHNPLSGEAQIKKRRMDWDTLEMNATHHGVVIEPQTQTSLPKVSNFAVAKDNRERKKVASSASTRLGWSDDIDFDLNTDLANNTYLNNETFLSLSSALTVLKQEIPSPSNGELKKVTSVAKNPLTISKDLVSNQSNETQLNPEIIKGKPNASIRNNNINENNKGNICNTSIPEANDTLIAGEKCISTQVSNNTVLDNNGPNEIINNPTGASQQISNPEQYATRRNEKCNSDELKFQYILAAATSIATKSNEETITYLNQGQSYEIKLKKLGDLSAFRGKVLKSIIKICFHERRLQYMEREQMNLWQASRPGERIIEIDVPLSYGLCHVAQPNKLNQLNTVEVLWDPMKEVGVYIKINCISTEFTPKKHGGEKGVPFRIQIETYLDNVPVNNLFDFSSPTLVKPIHAAACQVKVFKLKGADRKHKQDREKIQKRPPSEKDKYQPSYECTILNDISCDLLMQQQQQSSLSPDHVRSSVSPIISNSPVHITKYESIYTSGNSNPANPVAINSVSSSNCNIKVIDQNAMSPPAVQPQIGENDDYNSSGYSGIPIITKDTTTLLLTQWLNAHRFSQYANTFAHFCGADLLRMSKEDMIQICGLADGIRMFNILHAKAISPRLTIYVNFDGSSYHAVYLYATTTKELSNRILKLPGFIEYFTSSSSNVESNAFSWNLQSKFSASNSNLYEAPKLNIYTNGPSGIHVYITDDVLGNIKDESLFALEVQNNKVLLKAVYKTETN